MPPSTSVPSDRLLTARSTPLRPRFRLQLDRLEEALMRVAGYSQEPQAPPPQPAPPAQREQEQQQPRRSARKRARTGSLMH